MEMILNMFVNLTYILETSVHVFKYKPIKFTAVENTSSVVTDSLTGKTVVVVEWLLLL